MFVAITRKKIKYLRVNATKSTQPLILLHKKKGPGVHAMTGLQRFFCRRCQARSYSPFSFSKKDLRGRCCLFFSRIRVIGLANVSAVSSSVCFCFGCFISRRFAAFFSCGLLSSATSASVAGLMPGFL